MRSDWLSRCTSKHNRSRGRMQSCLCRKPWHGQNTPGICITVCFGNSWLSVDWSATRHNDGPCGGLGCSLSWLWSQQVPRTKQPSRRSASFTQKKVSVERRTCKIIRNSLNLPQSSTCHLRVHVVRILRRTQRMLLRALGRSCQFWGCGVWSAMKAF